MVENKEDELSTPLIGTEQMDASANTSDSEEVVDEEHRQVVAAGVGSAVIGMCVGGPVGAALLGFTGAYAARHKEGAVGDAARKIGHYAIAAKEKVTGLDSNYKVVERSGQVWNTALEKDPGVLKKGQEVVVSATSSATDFVVKKKLIQRGTEEIGGRVCWALEKIVGGNDRVADPYAG